MGYGPELNDEMLKNREEIIKNTAEKNAVVIKPSLSLWKNDEYTKQINNLYDKYMNVDPKLWNFDQSKVTLKKEEPESAQQLYSVLSPIMQEVLTNENADVRALVADAAKRFQTDTLDKLEN